MIGAGDGPMGWIFYCLASWLIPSPDQPPVPHRRRVARPHLRLVASRNAPGGPRRGSTGRRVSRHAGSDGWHPGA